MHSTHILVFVLLSVSTVNISLHCQDELRRVSTFFSSFSFFFFFLSVFAMDIFLHRHDELYRVYMFYVLSCCLSQL